MSFSWASVSLGMPLVCESNCSKVTALTSGFIVAASSGNTSATVDVQ
jgi:hypothetical protein